MHNCGSSRQHVRQFFFVSNVTNNQLKTIRWGTVSRGKVVVDNYLIAVSSQSSCCVAPDVPRTPDN
jgi:uncharacterized protein YaiI (UPF0178 family)